MVYLNIRTLEDSDAPVERICGEVLLEIIKVLVLAPKGIVSDEEVLDSSNARHIASAGLDVAIPSVQDLKGKRISVLVDASGTEDPQVVS